MVGNANTQRDPAFELMTVALPCSTSSGRDATAKQIFESVTSSQISAIREHADTYCDLLAMTIPAAGPRAAFQQSLSHGDLISPR
jgi:hypothetical protein